MKRSMQILIVIGFAVEGCGANSPKPSGAGGTGGLSGGGTGGAAGNSNGLLQCTDPTHIAFDSDGSRYVVCGSVTYPGFRAAFTFKATPTHCIALSSLLKNTGSCIAKFDKDGRLLWGKPQTLLIDSFSGRDGAFYGTNRTTTSGDAGVSSFTHEIFRLDANGDVAWKITNVVPYVYMAGSSSFVVSGTESIVGVDSSLNMFLAGTDNSSQMWKYDPSGMLLWTMTPLEDPDFGYFPYPHTDAIAVDDNGRSYLTSTQWSAELSTALLAMIPPTGTPVVHAKPILAGSSTTSGLMAVSGDGSSIYLTLDISVAGFDGTTTQLVAIRNGTMTVIDTVSMPENSTLPFVTFASMVIAKDGSVYVSVLTSGASVRSVYDNVLSVRKYDAHDSLAWTKEIYNNAGIAGSNDDKSLSSGKLYLDNTGLVPVVMGHFVQGFTAAKKDPIIVPMHLLDPATGEFRP